MCLSLVMLVTFFSQITDKVPFQNVYTGSIYAVICVAGIVLGLHPPRFAKRGSITREEVVATGYKGHHPTCGRFTSHVIRFQNRTLCAGCSGLVVGAVLSLAGSLYFFFDLQLGEASIIIYIVGMVFIAMGIFQYSLLKTSYGAVHFFTNVLFVVGTMFLLIGFNEINGSVLVFYLFAIMIFWIIARIVHSQVEHDRICLQCGRRCIATE